MSNYYQMGGPVVRALINMLCELQEHNILSQTFFKVIMTTRQQDVVVPLVADPSQFNSTARQNKPISVSPLYITITFDPIIGVEKPN